LVHSVESRESRPNSLVVNSNHYTEMPMKNDDSFPKLTILPDTPAPAQPRLSNSEKYGSLYWLGISGLVVSILLVGWFTWNLVAMRQVWRAVYVLHDTSGSTESRLAAVETLLNDPRVQPSQVQPMIFRPTLPDKARYLLAESLEKALSPVEARQMLGLLASNNATAPPNWLRGQLARLAAVTIPAGRNYPAESFRKLMGDDDAVVADWAAYALAVNGEPADAQTANERLTKRAAEGSPLANALVDAAKAADKSAAFALARRAMRSETAANQAIFSP
jgi:hypothetical protein